MAKQNSEIGLVTFLETFQAPKGFQNPIFKSVYECLL